MKKNQKRTRRSAIPETCGFEHGVYKGEAVHVHEDAVGKRQEPETGEDGKRIGKGSFQGFLFLNEENDFKRRTYEIKL